MTGENSWIGAREFLYVYVTEEKSEVYETKRTDTAIIMSKSVVEVNPSELTIIRSEQPSISTEEPAPFNEDNLRPMPELPFVETQMNVSAPGIGQIQIKGYFYYYDRNNNLVPAHGVTVWIYDKDTLTGDDYLGSAFTSANGYFESDPISNSDGEGGTQDVYLRFIAASNAREVRDVNDEYYDGYTAIKDNVPDGGVDFGSLRPPDTEKKAWWIYYTLFDGWNYLANKSGANFSMELSTARWADGHNANYGFLGIGCVNGTHYHRGGQIHIDGTGGGGHANDPDVILHEYGHNIMWVAYGHWFPTTNCPSPHYYNVNEHVNCAWTEGWASFFPLAAYNDKYFSDTHQGFQLNFESGPWSGWDCGYDVEGRVTAALWDIYDTADDGYESYDGGFLEIWEVFEGQNDNTYEEFWNAWRSSPYNNNVPGANSANFQNTIDFNENPSATVISPNGGWYSGNILISASASDPDGSISKVKFYYSLDCFLWYYIGEDISSSGGWSTTWDSSVISYDSSVWVKAVAYDNLGHWSECTFSYAESEGISFLSFGIDNTSPNTTITSGPSGTITYDDVTFQWTGTDNVTSTSNLVYSYYLQGYDSGWSSYTSSTSKTYSNLPNGTYTFQVRAKDQAGNADPTPDTRTFTVNITPSDTTPPNTSITSGPSGTITYDDVTFQWTGTDNITSTSNLVYSYYLQGYDSGWSSYTSATSKSYSNLSNGTYTFQVRAKDQAGNADPTPATRTFTVQVQVGGEVIFLEPHNGDTVTPNENGNVLIRVEYTGSDCPYYFDIYIDGVRKAHIRSYLPCTTSASYYWPTFEYSDGYHSLYACVTYQDETLIAESETTQVYLDNPESPQIQITNPASNETVSGLVDIIAKVTTDRGIAYSITKVGFYVDGSNIGWVFDPSSQENSYTFYYTLYNWDSTSVSDGQHTILAKVYDQYDRTAEHSITLIVQQSPQVNVQFNTYFMYDNFYGNNDGFANPGELIELYVSLENTGTQTAYEVTATATTTSPYINYSCAYPPSLTYSFGDILGGGIRTGYMYFMIMDAPDGTIITFDLTITDSSSNTWYDSFDIVVTGTDTLPPRAVTLKVSPQVLNAGNTVTIQAFVEEGDDMSSGSVMARIDTSDKAVAATVVLYDDGAHNDLNAGDGVFGGSWITTLPETDYLVSILTSDRSGNAAEWSDLAGFTTKTFTISNKILVVDDDNHNLNAWVTAASYQSYYTAALDANGLAYDVWEYFFKGSPHSSTLMQYDVVIWLTGDTYGSSYFTQGYYAETLSSTDQSNLITYLEGGGNLFICGQDIGYDLLLGDSSDESFYANYLHAAFVQDWTNLFGLYGVDGNPMTDGLYFTISGGDGANNQGFASEIDPINGAISILTYDPGAALTLQQPTLHKGGIPSKGERQMLPLVNQLPQGIISSGSGAISVDTGTYKVIYFAFGLEAIDNPADRNIIMRKIVHWLQGTVNGSVPQLFNTNSYLVVGDEAYCTDVLGTAKISYGLALGGALQNPEGRTHTILTSTEHTSGNLIIVGGPAINPVAVEFDSVFGVTYNYNPGVNFEIFYGGKSIYLDLTQYPNEDICIIYLGEDTSQNIMLVWGYGWRGTYAGSAFMGDPSNWQKYEGATMLMLRWTDSNADGLVQMSETTVESYEQPVTAKTVIRGVVNWLRSAADWVLSLLFNTDSYLVVGDEAYCTDVLGTAKISYGLAQGGASQNPEGRTHTILTSTEHTSGNLIIVGGPAINPLAVEFDSVFGITYDHSPGVSFQINAEGESINLDLQTYPQEDICIVQLAEHNSRNVLLVWGYGWYGSYAGSIFAGDPKTWKTYPNAHMFMLRWIDINGDGLVQKTEIFVEAYV
jgi:hypothetical protein